MLLPEFIVQPVAWSAILAIMVLLLLGKQQNKKTKLGWIVGGLGISYLVGAILGWQALLLNEIVGYIGLLFAGLVVLLGVYGIFDFFKKSDTKLHTKITQDLHKFEAIIKQSRPTWVYALAGVMVGIIEPVRLQTTQQNELFLLLSQPSPELIISLGTYLLIVFLPIILLVFCGWLIARTVNKASSEAKLGVLLWGSGAVIVAGWLLAALSTSLL